MTAAGTARWRAAHPERAATSQAKYRAANSERVAATNAAWQAANPERVAAANAKWRAAHAEKIAEYARRRRAQRLEAPGEGVTERQWAEILAERPYCHYCGDCTVDLVMEHMTPLARGGAHDVSNVTPACQPCNSRKHTKTADEFLAVLSGVPA